MAITTPLLILTTGALSGACAHDADQAEPQQQRDADHNINIDILGHGNGLQAMILVKDLSLRPLSGTRRRLTPVIEDY
jgi:hypothetical protein